MRLDEIDIRFYNFLTRYIAINLSLTHIIAGARMGEARAVRSAANQFSTTMNGVIEALHIYDERK